MCALLQISYLGSTLALGDYLTEAAAARAYDRALINKMKGEVTQLNFPASTYADEWQALAGEDLGALMDHETLSASLPPSRLLSLTAAPSCQLVGVKGLGASSYVTEGYAKAVHGL